MSAFLLFLVEPMAAKRLLPVLGGSSAVWVTCLVFFQATLLLGYLYAHWMVRRGTVRVHLAMLGAAVTALVMQWAFGIMVRSMGIDVEVGSASDHPVTTIFSMLTTTIGLPFLMLSATSPLLQVWWVRRQGGGGNAVSAVRVVECGVIAGVGGVSAAGGVAYATLAMQRDWWMVGFVVFAVMCGWVALKTRGEKVVRAEGEYPIHDDDANMKGPPEFVAPQRYLLRSAFRMTATWGWGGGGCGSCCRWARRCS